MLDPKRMWYDATEVMMQNIDELSRIVGDKQVRYRHEAYRDRLNRYPVRRWIGTRLVRFGESIRGCEASHTAPAPFGQSLP